MGEWHDWKSVWLVNSGGGSGKGGEVSSISIIYVFFLLSHFSPLI
jgi:hypothetical protein